MMGIATFDPQQVSIILGGTLIDGFSEDQLISIDYMEERYITKSGARGGTARTRVTNRQARATIYLLSTSPSNDFLSSLFNSDYYGGGNTVPFLLRDASGTSQASATTAFVLKPPPLSFSKDVQTREWLIHIDDLQMFVGGNTMQGS